MFIVMQQGAASVNLDNLLIVGANEGKILGIVKEVEVLLGEYTVERAQEIFNQITEAMSKDQKIFYMPE